MDFYNYLMPNLTPSYSINKEIHLNSRRHHVYMMCPYAHVCMLYLAFPQMEKITTWKLKDAMHIWCNYVLIDGFGMSFFYNTLDKFKKHTFTI
jgi:hypothetical protein